MSCFAKSGASDLALLVGIGEVQEYIDVADFATGLSRSLNGQVLMSESTFFSVSETVDLSTGFFSFVPLKANLFVRSHLSAKCYR